MRTRLDTRGALRSVACTLGVLGAVLAAAVFGGFALGACRAADPASATGSVASTPDASARDAALRTRTLAYLREHMPERDRATLPAGFLEEHVDLALQARAEFPWAAAVPEELFLNDVAPYAVLDEPRDPWRRELLELCRPIVAECRTATEAAQALNRELFKTIGLHYNTERERANQSFVESKKSGKASCTGLSIALVDACRAVGIPARAAGTPKWTKKDGNHTWVEVWDGAWHFAGADEYDANGLDRGWFVGDASDARADRPENRIYATSWARAGVHFPLAWNPADTSVAGVDVTARYAKAGEPAPAQIFVRVFAKRGGERIAAEVELVDASGSVLAGVTSRAGTSDLNDMPSFASPSDGAGTLRVRFGGVERSCSLAQARGATARGDSATLELCWDELAPSDPVAPLAKDDAKRVRDELVAARRAELRAERAAEVEAKVLTLGDKSLRWLERSFGDAPDGERSLWISLHGGGGAPVEVNDGQWKNQIQLYEPAEGFYVAPRAPTDTWNLWHEGHIDPLFARLIEDFVALRGVDPERVYLLGYSAGGDGVWQLAPRIADRFAAAAMMAGHPNEASLLGLRNLPFAILMGAEDAAYDRNRIAKERAGELDALRSADAGGYEHFVRIYPGLGHWMERKDAEALPWMAQRHRVSWPKRVVWFQDDVVHERFYWLGRATDAARAGEHVVAEVDGQRLRIESHGARGLELWLSDELLDLDLPIVVERDGAVVFEGRVPRDPNVLRAELARSFDPKLAACARLSLAD